MMMQTANYYIPDIVLHTQKALDHMPLRSSSLARRMVKAALPVPQTREEIEHYVHNLLAKEQAVCNMATD